MIFNSGADIPLPEFVQTYRKGHMHEIHMRLCTFARFKSCLDRLGFPSLEYSTSTKNDSVADDSFLSSMLCRVLGFP